MTASRLKVYGISQVVPVDVDCESQAVTWLSAITLGERGADSLLRLFGHSPAVGLIDRC